VIAASGLSLNPFPDEQIARRISVSEGDLEAAERYSRQHIRRMRRYMTLAGHAHQEQ
jgi:hypothetical protein